MGKNIDRSTKVIGISGLVIYSLVMVDRGQQILGSVRLLCWILGPAVGRAHNLAHPQPPAR